MQSSRVGVGNVLNVGSGERHTINEIATLMGGPVVHESARQGEARDTLADISLTKELLDWEPTISFREGLGLLLREEGIIP